MSLFEMAGPFILFTICSSITLLSVVFFLGHLHFVDHGSLCFRDFRENVFISILPFILYKHYQATLTIDFHSCLKEAFLIYLNLVYLFIWHTWKNLFKGWFLLADVVNMDNTVVN